VAGAGRINPKIEGFEMNKQMKKLLVGACVTVAGSFALLGSAFAHHAVQGYTQGEEARITITGKVKEFRWTNPHTALYVDEVRADGTVRTWGFEMNSPGNLVRRGGGWTHNVVKPGDAVTVTFNPAVEDRPAGACIALTLADGRELKSGQGCGGFDNN